MTGPPGVLSDARSMSPISISVQLPFYLLQQLITSASKACPVGHLLPSRGRRSGEGVGVGSRTAGMSFFLMVSDASEFPGIS